MEFRVSPNKDLSLRVTEEEITKLDKQAGNTNYMDNAIPFVQDADTLSGAFLGCSLSKMFEKVPWCNGFQVVLPAFNDNIYLINVNPEIVKAVTAKGEYKAKYTPQSEATLEIRRQS
jgi:hypothetical protein